MGQTLEAYRILKTKYLDDALSGEGARLHGGRWNPKGTEVLYLSESLSAATLEILVHLEDHGTIAELFSFVRVSLPSDLVKELPKKQWPKNWDSIPASSGTQEVGERWVRDGKSAFLRVPSAITAGEFTLLGNPNHADFSKAKVIEKSPFDPDPRLTQ